MNAKQSQRKPKLVSAFPNILFCAKCIIMEQQRKPKPRPRKKWLDKIMEQLPEIGFDSRGSILSNFASNFNRNFKRAKGSGVIRLLSSMFSAQPVKPTSQPESIIGATKTVVRSDFKNTDRNQTVKTNQKPALKMGNAIKPEVSLKNKKAKLGL